MWMGGVKGSTIFIGSPLGECGTVRDGVRAGLENTVQELEGVV